MFEMDIDAFYEEQDQHMNEPEDDMEEFLARMSRPRNVPGFFSEADSLDFLAEKTPAPTNSSPVHGEMPSNNSIRLPSPKLKETISSLIPPLRSDPSKIEHVVEGSQIPKRKEPISSFLPPPNSKRSKSDYEEPRLPQRTELSPKHKEPHSSSLPSPSSKGTASDYEMKPVSPMPTRKSPRKPIPSPIRTFPEPSIPQLPPNRNSTPILKRKESPTKPEKPPRKKAAIDPSPGPSSPIEASPPAVKKPLTSKPKSSNRANRPTVKIPPAPVPEAIDLTMSPIEEPDFSVLVSRFEPEATSTQPKVAAAPSVKFIQMQKRMEKHSALKLERKVSKVSKPKLAAGDGSSIISVSSSPGPSSSEPNVIVPIKASTKAKAKATAKPKPKPAKAPPVKKGKGVKMLPKDYAQMLMDERNAPPDPSEKPRRVRQFLKGKNIFYTGGDMTWASEGTKGRMRLMAKHGANLFPVFDPALVTHIVSEAFPPATLRALGVKSMKEVPAHIPILKWTWVCDYMDGGTPGPLFEYAAFADRVPEIEYHSRAKGKGKQPAVPDASADLSRISNFTQDKKPGDDESSGKAGHPGDAPMSPPSSPRHKIDAGEPSSSRVKLEGSNVGDSLAEFYEEARAQRDNAFGRPGEAVDEDETDVEDAGSDTDNEASRNPGPAPKRGFTCDNKEVQRRNGPNEFIAKKLDELRELHKAKPGQENYWRVYSYNKCIRAVRNHHKPIISLKEARLVRGVGEKTALKIMEIVETGDLRRIKWENTADVSIGKLFQGIYGVGQTTAIMWYAAGCRTLEDLKAGKGGVVLTPAQKIGIQFYDDINDRMPREEAKALFELIKPIALSIDPKLEIQIMGSYRRSKADCGDIDIMITRCPKDGTTHAGILHHLLKALHARKIITEDLAMPENPFGDEAIYRGLCRLPQFGSRRRRIDFLTIPYSSRGAALLYYTGDDIFNRAMRLKANKLGYSLNQKGLFAGVVRDPRNRSKKTNEGTLVASETEEQIFKILEVPFQQPHERVRG
ncbi:hypothetical protein B0H17DRAFT_1096959 [Mycena rosella]|uniref:DNA-directed DNA polymerase n=1 Tax=Mycena rosella TaxID=1033263 RepID=A0AAD7G1M8_MYCRO|nr:hypothetical protein B0H17DRAFT_1096959 [Mycena rosella]